MDSAKFQEIKERAIEEKIPIIMDDTLEVLEKYFQGKVFENILEIGTAVRIFCDMFC